MKIGLKPSTRVSSGMANLILLLGVVLIMLTSCGKFKKDVKKQPPPVPVDIAEVLVENAPLFINAIGNVAAYNTVDVKSRVTGELIKTFFKAGDPLTDGQDLFTIDPAPFEAKVQEGEAQLNQSRVQYEQAKRDFLRYKGLFGEKAVSEEQLEAKQVDMNSKLYQMKLNEAQLDSAKLNLGYCSIRSPITGPSGEIYIDNFNIVNANQDRLVTIKQIHPIKVKFSVPGKFLDQINKYNTVAPLQVDVLIQGSEKRETGQLTLIDNNINLRTGMIALEGTFANPESRLWPGQFVEVRLKLTTTIGALLVPARSVNDGPDGQYVWAVNQDQTVAMRPVKVDRRETDMAVISEGLKPNERVITDGQLMLRPGAIVITKEQMQKALQATSSRKDGKVDSIKGGTDKVQKP
ncbi:MAG: efflux RND transporter periplasmic adaptor subunit [Desulfomonilaceae bacterium]